MAGNMVTLTFAGETKSLSKSLDDVGTQSQKMADKVESSSKSLEEWGEKAGTGDQRAMGFRDTITGLQDTFSGLTDSSQDLGTRLFTLGAGIGDLFSSAENLLIPALGKIGPVITETVIPAIVEFATSVGATLVAPLITAGSVIFGTVVPAVWSFTAALLANPIVWIVVGIVALIAILVLLINHFDLVQAAWTAVTQWIGDRVHDVGAFFSWLGDMIPKWIGAAWDWIKSTFNTVVGWIGGRIDDIGGFFSRLGSAILAPFKWAFNEVATAWNRTIGSLHFTIPDWVPLIGGASFSVPKLPTFHTGGVVPGLPGSDVLAVLQAGETVIPRTGGAAGGGAALTFAGNTDSAFAAAFMSLLASGAVQISPTYVR